MDTVAFLALTLVMGAPRRYCTHYEGQPERRLADAWHKEADRRGWRGPSLHVQQFTADEDH